MNHAILDEDGTVMQFVGDAVMACFGAPVAAGRPRRSRVRGRGLDARSAGRARRDLGRARAPAVRSRHRTLDRPGRRRAARLGRTARVHARRRHREPRATAAGPRAAGRMSRVQRGHACAALTTEPECEPLGEQAIKGRQGAVRAFKYQVVGSPDQCRRSTMTDESPILVTRGLRKNFESEGAPVRALARRRLHDEARRVRRGHGTVGLRQVDAAQPRRRSRHRDRRRDHARRRVARRQVRRSSSRSCGASTSASCSSSSTCSRA